MNERIISDIKRHGKTAKGKQELIKHLEGKRLTLKQAVYGHCFDCMGMFADGKHDCNLSKYPLHPFMSYNENRIKRTSRTVSEGVQKDPSFALAGAK
ncbi:MAG: hypothetical protein ABSD50_06390 [Smithella sp.]